MKNWQFCMLMVAIYLAPVDAGWVNVTIAAVFLVFGAVAFFKDRA